MELDNICKPNESLGCEKKYTMLPTQEGWMIWAGPPVWPHPYSTTLTYAVSYEKSMAIMEIHCTVDGV